METKTIELATEEYLDDITPTPEVLEMVPEHKLSQRDRDKRDEMIMEGLG